MAEPLWRGPAGLLGSMLDLKGATGTFGVGVDDQVAVVRVDSLPTREQVRDAVDGVLNNPRLFPGAWSRTPDHHVDAVTDAVVALFGQTEGAT